MMQGIFEEMHSPDQDSDFKTKETQDFVNTSQTENDDQEAEDEDFSFTCGGAATSPIAAEDAFINGRIKPIFPLFDRNLFLDNDEPDSLLENLPADPPVKKIFVETKDSGELPSANAQDVSTVRKMVEVSPEVCKKSNSTGFSKIWRFKDFLGRSHSDGRDAFVFLNDSSQAAATEEKVVKKGKTASLSSHEVYLRSKARDGEKRRSYLPYRPELMGFFTNVNTGMSKNVHPY